MNNIKQPDVNPLLKATLIQGHKLVSVLQQLGFINPRLYLNPTSVTGAVRFVPEFKAVFSDDETQVDVNESLAGQDQKEPLYLQLKFDGAADYFTVSLLYNGSFLNPNGLIEGMKWLIQDLGLEAHLAEGKVLSFLESIPAVSKAVKASLGV